MAEVTYALCALTSVACVVLLALGYRRTRNRLLLWTAVCFAGFAVNNSLLLVDLIVVPGVDLSIARILPALAGVCALLYGLVREAA